MLPPMTLVCSSSPWMTHPVFLGTTLREVILPTTSRQSMNCSRRFVQITQSIVIPLVVQAISGPITAVALYCIAIQTLTPGLSLAVSSVALIYPPLAYVMYGDPYETCFAPAVTVWLFLAVMERRWAIAALFATLALSIKDDQSLFLGWDALLCLLWAIRKHDIPLRNVSLLTFGASMIVGLRGVSFAMLCLAL